MPTDTWMVVVEIWLAVALAFGLVSLVGVLIDRHIHTRKSLEFRRYIKSRSWE